MPSNILYPTPWTVDFIKPQLHAYRRGIDHPLVIPFQVTPETAAILLEHNGFLSAPRLTFVVHGFRNTVEIPWMSKIKDELLIETYQTVVLIDWGNGANLIPPRYLQAAANIQTVGVWLADYLTQIGTLKPNISLWGIGHSLGCHLLGITGRHSGRFDRISAMDPAGPAFEKHEFRPFRLCPTDAKIVDVIHTDGYDSFLDPEDWISPVNHYGTLIPLGTIDFYPNYGYNQPGAGPVSSHLIAAGHQRAIELFIWSIGNPEKFATYTVLDGTPEFESPVTKVKEVDKLAEMGYHSFRNPAQEGMYFLQTNKAEPWVEETTEIDSLVPNNERKFVNEEIILTPDNGNDNSTSSCVIL